MAKKKNLEMYDRALRLYSLYTLTTEEKQKEFAELTDEKQKVRVDGWKSRNKAIIVGDMLNDINKLNYSDLTTLKYDLENYLKELDKAFDNVKDKEIKEIDKEIERYTKEYNKQIERLNKKKEEVRNKE